MTAARTPAAEAEPGGTRRPASAGPVAVRPPSTAELVDRARARWRASLVTHAGDSALADVGRLGDALLDLSAAHPSGIAQLFAGRPARLSNLVREGSALSTARRRARAVAGRADVFAQRYGVASAFLAVGVATWTEQDDDADTPAADGATPVPAGDEPAPEGRDAAAAAPDPVVPPETDHGTDRGSRGGTDGGTDDPAPAEGATADPAPTRPGGRSRTRRAPVLLRPVTVRTHPGESEIELVLEPSLEVNPVLAAALRRRGALLDPAALARSAFGGVSFEPRQAVDRLRALGTALLADFHLEDAVLVGTFVHPEQGLVDDLDALAGDLAEHEVVAALAGDESAVRALAHPLPPRVFGDRTPDAERGVGDLDPAQAHVLDVLAAGHHVVVDAAPGSDVVGTVAAAVGDAVAAGRTVLYVGSHRRSADALTARLAVLGLDDAVLDVAPRPGWREEAGQRLLGAMTVDPVPVEAEKIAVVERELLDRRARLHGYVAALHARREPWGASVYDALQALARLTSTRPVPQTKVRLTPAVAEALTGERRAQAAADLVSVAALGAFSPATRASAWYGADLTSPDRAQTALRRVEHLLDHGLPHLHEQATRVAEDTGLTPARTPAEWAEQLMMLGGVRAALDVFRPLVFERSAADLVAATASAQWREERGIEMSGSLRRRLRKQAKDMLRPGRPVEDLHAALVEVQAQREVWRAHCPAGGWPRVPEGLARIELEHREVRADLDALSTVLAGTAGGGELATMTWDDLAVRLGRLRADRAALDTLPERTALVRSLHQRGLGALLTDLADRRVGAGLVAAELDLAWWTTVFEQLLTADPALAGHDGASLTRLVAEFRRLDERFLEDRAVLARAAMREAVHRRMREADAQTQELFGEIVEGRLPALRLAIERHPRVARYLRPCLVASPMLVPHLLPATRSEDLVILDGASDMPLEEAVSAIARGRQVLVVGDTRCADGSALSALAAVLPCVPLPAHAPQRDPELTAFLSRHGYGHRLASVPLPRETGLLRLDLVDGSGMPGSGGVVEGTAAEVARAVELVVEHAAARPGESLAVVTPSAVHADRVRDAVTARAAESPALAAFLAAGSGAEPFSVVELTASQGLVRDAVILSVGFGRTPHGRVLHRFGPLTDEGGDLHLLRALGGIRRRLTVLACFGPQDLDPDRLRTPGATLLADLLELAARRSSPVGDASSAPSAGPDPDRLVLDLAERLWRMGLLVDVDHAAPGGSRIPLVVGHPDLPDEMLVAVLTDDDAYVNEPSVRVRDRQVPARLERLGWTVVQVWSAAAFLDPQAEAEAICAAAVEACARRSAERGRGVRDGATGAADAATAPAAVAGAVGTGASTPAPPPVPQARGPRPRVEAGLPASAYTDDQVDEIAAWLASDGVPRTEAELGDAVRAELGLTRRGARVDAMIDAAVRRAR